jgi:hypothetical protein
MWVAQVEHRHQANPFLTRPGTAVLVFRGIPRSLAIACPDGCGEQLTINLDHRAGPAWRLYGNGVDVTLYPSVWRTTGCKSHFIVWHSKIYWCDWREELDEAEESIVQKTLETLTDTFASHVEIADRLHVEPWAIASACHRLCRLDLAEAGEGAQRGSARRKRPP